MKGSNCPQCAGKHGIPLLTGAPHLAKEWMSEKNDRPIEKITSGSCYKAWWQCKTCDNQWQAKVAERAKGTACSFCSNASRKKQPYIINSDKDLCKEWITDRNDRSLEEITSGSGYKAWWKCKTCEHQWQAKVHNRVKGSGCPQCEGKHGTSVHYNFPELSKEWMTEKNGRSLCGVTTGSNYKAWWKCKVCSHQWQAFVISRAIKGTGCSKCSGRHEVALIEKAPHLKSEWMADRNDRSLEEITSGSAYKAWWKCKTCGNYSAPLQT